MLLSSIKLPNPFINDNNCLKIFKRFAGHNKWSKIRHTKGALDLKRGTQFAKLGLELIAAIRAGGTDPQFNLRYAAALATAKAQNLPKKNLDNAIKKATGQTDTPMEESLYQGMGPHGIAVIVETFSDNKNRTVKQVRSVLTKAGGSMTDVMWMFQKKGKIILAQSDSENCLDSDQIMDDVIEAGGDDYVVNDDKTIEVICEFENLGLVSSKLNRDSKYCIQSIAPYYHPTTEWCPIEDNDEIETEVQSFMDTLDGLEDVTRIHSNLPTE